MRMVEVEFVREFSGHRASLYSLFSGAEPQLFYSASGDGLIVAWDLRNKSTGKLVASTNSVLYSGCYLPATQEVVAGTRGAGVFKFSIVSGMMTGHIGSSTDYFDLVPFGDDSILGACGNGNIYLVSHGNPELVVTRLSNPTDKSARCLAISPDSKFLASGWSDGKVRIYSLASSLPFENSTLPINEITEFHAHIPSVFSLIYSGDGKVLISGGRDAKLKVWDTVNNSLLKEIPAHWYTINHLALSPDGKLFASASRDKTIKIWDTETYDLLKVIDASKFPAHTHSVNRLMWSSFDNFLISAGDDKLIKVWSVKLKEQGG